MRVAAIQLQSIIGDIDANLAAGEQLADKAANEGAEWIILPEFFTTGAAFLPELARLAHRSLPPDSPPQPCYPVWPSDIKLLSADRFFVEMLTVTFVMPSSWPPLMASLAGITKTFPQFGRTAFTSVARMTD